MIGILRDAGKATGHYLRFHDYLTLFNHCHVNYVLKTPQSQHPFISLIPGARDKDAGDAGRSTGHNLRPQDHLTLFNHCHVNQCGFKGGF